MELIVGICGFQTVGRTEDGIFGTSGGIGFTKANELFVGRVAMLGFAVSKHRSMELSAIFEYDRLTCIGWGFQWLANDWVRVFDQASILGEALTGKGTLAQFDIETGIPLTETEPLLLFFILFTLLGAIGALGDRGKFVDDAPVVGLESAIIKPGKGVKAALGLNEKGKHAVSCLILLLNPLECLCTWGNAWIFDMMGDCFCRPRVRLHEVERAVRGAVGPTRHCILHHWRGDYWKGHIGAAQHRDGRAHHRNRAAHPLQRHLLLVRSHQPGHWQVRQRRRRRGIDTELLLV